MEIRAYTPADEATLFAMMREEGDDWKDYWGNPEKYRRALAGSITFIAWEGGELAGFARCRDDGGYGLYIYDLLVRKPSRGKYIGRALMEYAAAQFPGAPTYVMSDVDIYYGGKLGYKREGTIFIVK